MRNFVDLIARWTAAGTAMLLTLAASAALAAPDLVIDSLESSPTSGSNGQTVQVSATIRNQGDTAAAASVARVRINQDATSVVSTDQQLCGSVPTPALEPGASAEVGCSQQLSSRPSGDNYIWMIGDVNKDIGQVAISNDRRSTRFTVTGEASDLVIASLEVDPVDAANGEEVRVSVTVRNDGPGTALASTTRIRISQSPDALATLDPTLCNISTPELDEGEDRSFECERTISSRPPGTNYIWAIADVNKTAGQLDTTNDRTSIPIEISPEASDLVIDSVVVDPPNARNGERVTVTAMIRNQGTSKASSSVTRVRMNLDPDTVTGTDPPICDPISTPSIDAGETVEVDCEAQFDGRPVGLNYIWVIADTGETAGQSDRTNDRTRAEFVVDPPLTPDLTIRTLTINPTSGMNGKSVTISARIANDGEGVSPASKTRFVINQSAEGVTVADTVLCDEVSTGALDAGSTVQVSCKATLVERPYGPNYVWAIADATGTSGQVNLQNDTSSVLFTVLTPPAPDLVVESLVANPPSAGIGAGITITARIRNQGSLAAAASTARIRFNRTAAGMLDTDAVACNALATPALAAGAAADVVCNWTVAGAPGTAYLWASSDAGNTAGQFDRSNDSRSTAFSVLVPDGPNLTVRRLVVRPGIARNGETIIVKARVFNNGNETSASSLTAFRINQNAAAVSQDDQMLCAGVATRALAPDEGVRVRCAVRVSDRPLGLHSIWAIADSSGTSGQLDVSDDARRAAFEVVDVRCGETGNAPVFAWPIEQPRVLQDYASFGSVPLAGGRLGYHSGLDLLSHLPIPDSLTPVYAAADGEVVAVHRTCPSPADPIVNPPSGRCAGGWGNYVVLRHGAGIFSVYAHLGSVFVSSGCVEHGERIAIAGSSGSTSIPVHLHFDVLADLLEPVARKSFGNEYYKKYHPLAGRVPESETGAVQTHLDARDLMERSRIEITAPATASRGSVTGGESAYLAAGQQFVSYGELVPGYFAIDLPYATAPEDGPPYTDDVRYGWVVASKVDVLESGLAPGSVRIDGYGLFVDEGVGASSVALRQQPSASAVEISKAWGNQQFVPSGVAVVEPGSGKLWQPIDVPGTSASGATGPRVAYLLADTLATP